MVIEKGNFDLECCLQKILKNQKSENYIDCQALC